jgi:phosphatidylglycerol:prolipoprotein diacylglycerol transferase
MDSIARVFAFHDGGLIAHGALIAGAAAAFVAARRHELSPLKWFDAVSPGLAVGIVLTRVGCWLEGCDFGRTLSAGAPGALARLGSFPAESHAWVHQVITRTLSPNAPRSLPVHPSQLYEALGGVGLLALVIALRRRQVQEGTAAAVVFFGYALLRMLVDFTREPSREVWLGRVVLAVGLGLALTAFRRARVAV